MKKIYPFRITQSEGEVLMHLMNIKKLPSRTMAGYLRYKRHEKAIESLKCIGVIIKDSENILQVCDKDYCSKLLINNKIKI